MLRPYETLFQMADVLHESAIIVVLHLKVLRLLKVIIALFQYLKIFKFVLFDSLEILTVYSDILFLLILYEDVIHICFL